jgi:hypothetical protein
MQTQLHESWPVGRASCLDSSGLKPSRIFLRGSAANNDDGGAIPFRSEGLVMDDWFGGTFPLLDGVAFSGGGLSLSPAHDDIVAVQPDRGGERQPSATMQVSSALPL